MSICDHNNVNCEIILSIFTGIRKKKDHIIYYILPCWNFNKFGTVLGIYQKIQTFPLQCKSMVISGVFLVMQLLLILLCFLTDFDVLLWFGSQPDFDVLPFFRPQLDVLLFLVTKLPRYLSY